MRASSWASCLEKLCENGDYAPVPKGNLAGIGLRPSAYSDRACRQKENKAEAMRQYMLCKCLETSAEMAFGEKSG